MERNPFETEKIKSRIIRLAKKTLEIRQEILELSKQENNFFKAEEGFGIYYFFQRAIQYYAQEQKTKKFEKAFDQDLFEYFLSTTHYEQYEKTRTRTISFDHNQISNQEIVCDNQTRRAPDSTTEKISNVKKGN